MTPIARIGWARPLRLALALIAVAGSHLDAQTRATSPLWGDLAPGPHRVGYRVVKLRDATRQARRESPVTAAAERGYPLLVRYWYPATPRAGAAPITFQGYFASDIVDDRLSGPTPERIRQSDRDLKAFYERAQNFPFGAVADDLWSRLAPTPLTAVADATPDRGRFPIVVGVGGALGNAVLGEYLASHGYLVSVVSSPADVDLTAPARMEWYVRDVEFALAHLRDLPFADPQRVGTWGFSFAGMPALLAGMRAPEVDAVVSLESAIFYPQFAGQLRGNPFHEATNLRVPFLHMMRRAESAPNEQLAGFEALRYSKRIRYLLNDETLVHQDFGTHGMAAAAVLGKRPAALAASGRAMVANAEYVRHFLDAYVKRDASAAAWLARTPEQNGVTPGFLTIEHRDARTPAPTAREIIALINADGIRPAMARFHEARRTDPEAPLFAEAAVNGLAYQVLRGRRPADALELFRANVELYPRSGNVYDSMAEALEATGDSARALEYARKTLEVLPTDTTGTPASRENLRGVNTERIRRLSHSPSAAPAAAGAQWGALEKGPYAVGFRLEIEYDHSRRLAPVLDFEGKPNAGPLTRSMQIGVWYPAAPDGSAPPIAYGELAAASATRGPLSAVTAADRATAIRNMRAFAGFAFGREMTEAEASAIDVSATAARRNATPVAGTFPVVLAATDGSLSSMSVVFEYLASHGIAVVSAPSHRGLATLQATRPLAALETRVRDLEYLLARSRSYPFVDTTRVAVLGVNFDGMSALAFQMKNMAAAAVVSIDGWEGKRNSVETVRAGLHFDPRRMRVPYLVVLQDEVNPPPGLRHDPAVFDALAFSDRNRVVMTGLSHAYLVGNPLVYPSTPAPQRAGYELVTRMTRAVLSNALGLSAPTLASISGNAEDSHRALFKEAVHRPALPPVPDDAELERLIMDDQAVEKVERFLHDMRRTDSTYVLFPQQTMALYAFRFFRQGNARFALKLLELNAEAFPRSWSAADALANGYRDAGDSTRALATWQRAIALLAADPAIPETDRARLKRAIADKMGNRKPL